MKTYHVYSRLSAGVDYTEWLKGGGDLPVKGRTVSIKGGAGVASKHLVTPVGVHTEVTADEMEVLNAHPVFKLHKENGFVTVEEGKFDVESVVADMGNNADPSAPLAPADYEHADKTNSPAPVGIKKSRK